MNWLSLRNNQLKFKIAGKLPIILEEFIEEYTLNEWMNEWKQQNWKMPTCNRLDQLNQQLVTNKPVEFENNQLKFKTAGNLTIVLEEVIEYTPI